MTNVKYVIGQKMVEVFENILKTENVFIVNKLGWDLSMTEIHTIAVIGKNRLLMMSELAGQLHVTMGTLTVMINNLVKKGFVERYKSEKDRRIVKVGLTKDGRQIYDMHELFHENLVDALVGDFDEKEQAVVSQALKNLQAFIEKNRE
ncbi:MAG: MarR family transcriptional regulator [Lachnospiraceae bacterium]|nr:MarR family transcriptional regulator [Lachnospiraceae bacterium]